MRKLVFLFLSVAFIVFSQVQVGSNIDGEADND